ncbi:FdhF/YdeP family oxidoreductase [Spirosoma spitsbergense]|uniref:FdhF/YdeP family oxidoreductase n=1 Tax=Spirosoma spitsbergense TaxID=431554 RepID=UPI00037C7A08|nr:FdhF/YdeP family oxidoreductase [Spirosoma spitsbergense]
MEKSPNSERRPGNPAEQHAQNEPKSGEHPNQGTAMTTDHYEPVGKDNKENMDQPLDPAPDNVGAKRRNAVLAQPPEEFTGLKLEEPVTVAAGVRAVLQSMEFSWGEAGVGRGTQALLKLNQKDGYDCSSCAWPDPDGERSIAEFCESGAKATASDADTRRADPDFFAKHSVVALSHMTDRDLNNAGRLTHPMVLRPGATHYTQISWPEAFHLIATELNALQSPDEAIFYTSGKVPNEPAYLYQLFARQFGTNNLPDCSNMCHESSGSALSPTLGLGKGSVTLNDLHEAEVILIMGQNPATNAPRMLTALQIAKRKGAKIIAINPLPETSFRKFKNPQDFMNPIKAVSTLAGPGTSIADVHLQVRVNGDMAVLRGIMKHLLQAEERNPGQILDKEFIQEFTVDYDDFLDSLNKTSWEDIEHISGLTREQLLEAANIIAPKQKIITCWAMGITQQKNGVATIKEIVNMHLMKGAIGKPGAGTCPVRGHSNVQGDRTMGVWEKPQKEFLDALVKEYSFEPPREHGFDTVNSIKAMHDGKTKVFMSLGGNLLSAGPDTEFVAEGIRKQTLTIYVSTKINRGHLVTGKTALILPCLTHLDTDRQRSGQQFTSCENSMGVVSINKGMIEPLEGEMLSEVAIICGIAISTLGERTTTNWVSYVENYDNIRDDVSRVIPGFDKFNEKIRKPGGFYLPNGPRERKFTTESGKAHFTVTEMKKHDLAPDQLVLMSIRSHDQFNTTIYDYNDRYRGVFGERRVIFMNRQDMQERGIQKRQLVNITSHFAGQKRHLEKFIAIPYNIPKGDTAAYFPEMNPLVPIHSVADVSNTPTSKFVVITVEPVAELMPEGSTKAVPIAEAAEA